MLSMSQALERIKGDTTQFVEPSFIRSRRSGIPTLLWLAKSGSWLPYPPGRTCAADVLGQAPVCHL
jgi:hypothetical protein